MTARIASSQEDRGLTVTWSQIATVCMTLLVGMFGGLGWLSTKLIDAYDSRLTAVDVSAKDGLSGAQVDIREIRQAAEGFRKDLSGFAGQMIQVNQDIGRQVSLLRDEFTKHMARQDDRLDESFKRIEGKIDALQKIDFGPQIELNQGQFRIDVNGKVFDGKGDLVGTLPAVVRTAP